MSAELPTIDCLPTEDGAYAESAAVTGAARTLYISGQIPTDPDGSAPADFGRQCRNAWGRVLDVLARNDMRPENLVKVTTFLRDRDDRDENRRVRQDVLGAHRPALTVVVVDLYEADWLVEIEAVAMA
ncbi:RidA family protein [Amycolatopsis sp. OK19-0408]|uniref:RidA family protein n=1 Tax=Amycolatopsis iheyensis TaxID=2945988 RepID=A0A9X2N8J0_9PSEU|nr:RidA family protein [Amycolatopsis iheyensis]MCR6482863.1 RidA family protein [Amycolatopsis iheyensis]